MSVSLAHLTRWRLALGEAADDACRAAGGGLDADARAMDGAMEWLYGRDRDLSERGVKRQGGRGASQLSSPEWIEEIHRLFPKATIERLERDAIERFAIDDIVTNLDVLARAEPNETLLRAVLRTKHLMASEVLAMARKLVHEVVRRLMEALARDMSVAFSGAIHRRRHSRAKIAANLDFKRVVSENLKHYDPRHRRITPERLRFFARNQRRLRPWQVILLVDQSGSMVSSVIHSAVTAACLWGLPGVRTHLVAFDTAVVDLTQDVTDPVELLMKVQLGGGTDIAGAVGYAQTLIDEPARAVVVLITDFFEGGSAPSLIARVKALIGQRTRVLGLAALDANADPSYNRELAQNLANVGAEIGAMTPGELAAWLAEKIRD